MGRAVAVAELDALFADGAAEADADRRQHMLPGRGSRTPKPGIPAD
jgi:hypothetical protein